MKEYSIKIELEDRGINLLEDLPVDNINQHYTLLDKVVNTFYGYECNKGPLISHWNLLKLYDHIYPLKVY